MRGYALDAEPARPGPRFLAIGGHDEGSAEAEAAREEAGAEDAEGAPRGEAREGQALDERHLARQRAGLHAVNLKDVEDSAGDAAPDLEARFGRKHLDSEHLGVSYFRYGPGVRSPMGHSHREQEEAYVVVSGSGQVRLDDEIVELRAWDVVRVAPAVVRGFEGGPDGLELIAIGADRPEGGDGVRVAEWWPKQ